MIKVSLNEKMHVDIDAPDDLVIVTPAETGCTRIRINNLTIVCGIVDKAHDDGHTVTAMLSLGNGRIIARNFAYTSIVPDVKIAMWIAGCIDTLLVMM